MIKIYYIFILTFGVEYKEKILLNEYMKNTLATQRKVIFNQPVYSVVYICTLHF